MNDLRPVQYRCGLIAIFLVAFVVRLGVASISQGLGTPLNASHNPDQLDYERLAYHLSDGAGYSLEGEAPSACRPPGTSFTLLPVYLVFGRSFLAGRVWLCLLSALTCVATAQVAAFCFSRIVGLVAGTLLSLYPGHIFYARHFFCEPPAALALTLAVGFSLAALRDHRWRDDLGAGLCWGLAVLTRPNFLLAVPLTALARLIVSDNRRQELTRLMAQAVVLSLVVGPWVARNTVVMGEANVCTVVGGHTFWGAHNPITLNDPAHRGSWVPYYMLRDEEHPLADTLWMISWRSILRYEKYPLPSDEVDSDKAMWEYGKQFVRSHWSRMPELCLWKLYRLVGPPQENPNRVAYAAFAAGWYINAPFVVIGMVLAWRRRRAAAAVLVVPIIVILITAVIFYGCDRFRDGISPILEIFASVAVVELVRLWIVGRQDEHFSVLSPSQQGSQ